MARHYNAISMKETFALLQLSKYIMTSVCMHDTTSYSPALSVFQQCLQTLAVVLGQKAT